MAKMSFDEITSSKSNNSSKSTGPYIGYLFFKDRAGNPLQPVVRFPYKSADEFEILTVHTVKEGNRFTTVNCLYDKKNPDQKCPFCENAEKVGKSSLRFIVKLIEYTTDENGNIVAEPRSWNAPFAVAKSLKAMMEEYPDLSKFVFKLKQSREGGQTTYNLIPARADVYTEDKYPADFSAFADDAYIRYQVKNKSAGDMNTFLDLDHFPEYKKEEEPVVQSASRNLDRIDTSGSDFETVSARPVRQETVTTEDIPQRPRRYTY